MIEDDLQVLGALCVGLARQRPRFIGHEAHRLDNAPPLALERLIVLVDQLQQHREIGSRVAGAQLQLVQLRAQIRVQIRVGVSGRARLRPHERCGGAGGCLGGVGERPQGLGI
ncbi:MAG TPA: hypothetical protein VN874_02060 [Myxococcales bacterium]|nr:hypothetical protein [Myxococcales bacterium]